MRRVLILCALLALPQAVWAQTDGPTPDAPEEAGSSDAAEATAAEGTDNAPAADGTESAEGETPGDSTEAAAEAVETEVTESTEETEAAIETETAAVEAEGTAEPESEGEIGEAVSMEMPSDVAESPDLPLADEEVDEEAEEEEPSDWDVSLHGEFRFRVDGMADLPLHTEERTGFSETLDQNWWATTWLRLTGEVSFRRQLRLVGQIDVADGVIFGENTSGVSAAARPRDDTTAFRSDGIDPRWLYLEYLHPKVGMFRMGLQPSHWGLGLLANDGAHEPPFGDYRYGNTSIRLMFGTRPAGQDVPLNLVLAGDLVYRDPLAQLTEGERALQAILAVFYGDPEDDVIGAYVVRRGERRRPSDDAPYDTLNVWAMDLFARTQFTDPTGNGEIILAFEGVHIRGDTTYTRTVDRPTFDVSQWMFAFQAGRTSDLFDVFLEAGYTSGDSNTEDSVQRRATMHPDHRIGLILFPEVMAWNTARSSSLAQSDELVGRPPPGSDLLPSNGGVSGAAYLFNWWTLRPTSFLDINAGVIWARATADVVDAYRQRSQSRSVNYRGGAPGNRGLGLELDASVMLHADLPFGMGVKGGIEGGVLFPGDAFDDQTGMGMDTMWLVRARAAFLF